MEVAKKLGFEEIYTFEQMQPIAHRIKKKGDKPPQRSNFREGGNFHLTFAHLTSGVNLFPASLGKPLLEPSLAVSLRNRGRIIPTEAGAAIVIVTGQAVQVLDRQISQRVCPDHLTDLGYRMMAGDQAFLRVYVGSVITGV